MFLTRNVSAEIFSILIATTHPAASDDDHYDEDIRARLARIKIDAHCLIEWKESSLILAETDSRRETVLEERHERDLNRTSCSVHNVAELDKCDRTGHCFARIDVAADEHIPAARHD